MKRSKDISQCTYIKLTCQAMIPFDMFDVLWHLFMVDNLWQFARSGLCCLFRLSALTKGMMNEWSTAGTHVFLIHMSIIWIYVMSCVHPSSWPAVLQSKKFHIGYYMQIVQPNFHTCHAYRHHWLLPFYTVFTDLDFTRGHKLSTWSGWNLMWWWSTSIWTSWEYFE